jgi:hypothetical protein
MFAGKAGTYPSDHLSGAPLLGRLLALPTNIRLGWKGLPVENALAYITNIRKLRTKKSFTTLGPVLQNFLWV